MVTGAAGKHTKIEKTTASRESGFQLSRYLLWNVYDHAVTATQKEILKAFNMTARNVTEQAVAINEDLQSINQ